MQFEPTDDIGRAIGRLTSRIWPVAVSPEVARFAYRPLLRDSPKKLHTLCLECQAMCRCNFLRPVGVPCERVNEKAVE